MSIGVASPFFALVHNINNVDTNILLIAMVVPEEPKDFPPSRSMEEPDFSGRAMDTGEPSYAILEEEPDSRAMLLDTIPEEPEDLMNATSRIRIPTRAEYCDKSRDHTMCEYKVIFISNFNIIDNLK